MLDGVARRGFPSNALASCGIPEHGLNPHPDQPKPLPWLVLNARIAQRQVPDPPATKL